MESDRVGTPAVTILDLMMPEIDGWDICKMVRQHREKEVREMGLLMLTARGSAEDRVRGLALGADDYLTKPFSISELLLRVEKMFRRQMWFPNWINRSNPFRVTRRPPSRVFRGWFTISKTR